MQRGDGVLNSCWMQKTRLIVQKVENRGEKRTGVGELVITAVRFPRRTAGLPEGCHAEKIHTGNLFAKDRCSMVADAANGLMTGFLDALSI